MHALFCCHVYHDCDGCDCPVCKIRQNMQNTHSYIRTYIVYVKMTGTKQNFTSFYLNLYKKHQEKPLLLEKIWYTYTRPPMKTFLCKNYTGGVENRRQNVYTS